jgi:hypothetical protein
MHVSFGVAKGLGLMVVALFVGHTINALTTSAEFPVPVGVTNIHSATEYDFGRVKAGTVVDHVFRLHNDSLEPWHIVEVKSNCGCTVATPASMVVPAKDSLELLATLKTVGKAGPVDEEFRVFTDSGTNYIFRLTGYAEPVHLAPLPLGEVTRGNNAARRIPVEWGPSVGQAVRIGKYDRSKLALNLEPRTPGRYELSVQLADRVPFGYLEEVVPLHTNDTLVPQKTLTVSAYVPYPVESDPKRLAIGTVSTERTSTGSVRLYSPYFYPISIEDITQEDEFPVSIQQTRLGPSEIRLKVSFRPPKGFDRQIYKATLCISVRAEGILQQVNVDVYGLS